MRGIIKEFQKKHSLYMMMIPGVVAFLIFNYFPMAGLVVAFKNFNFRDGLFFSPWAGLANFKFFINSPKLLQIIRNTVGLNFSFIIVHTVLQVSLALMLNEVGNRAFKRISQSIMFFPFFISWIIVSVFIYNVFNYHYGSLNVLLKSMGSHLVSIYDNPTIWPLILIVLDSWKWLGFGMVIYLAALAGINPEYYESAMMDGANRWQLVRRINLPLLLPTISILTLLGIGKIFNSDFTMFYALVGDNASLYSTTDVIDTFVYRSLRVLGDFGMSSAVGFLQSIVGFILVLGSNLLVRRFQEEGVLF